MFETRLQYLSHTLIYLEEALNCQRYEYIRGLKVNSILVHMLRFADDIVKTADSGDIMERTLLSLDKTLKWDYNKCKLPNPRQRF